jgi:cell surface protein SprA
VFDDPQRFGLPSDVSGDSLKRILGESLFVEERLRRESEGEVLRSLVLGDASPRTESYRQRLSATLRLGILDRQALNWIGVQDISYQSSFNWRNGAEGSLTGASVDNSAELRTGVSLKPNKVWERFGFYERMKQAQREDASGGAGRTEPPPDAGEADDPDDPQGEGEPDEEDGFDLDDVPLPDPVGLLRGLALTFMDIDDITVNYTGSRTARATNVGVPRRNDAGTVTGVNTNYSLLDAVQGEGPSLGYRLGLTRSIDTTKRVFQQGQVSNTLSNQHRFEARTALTPSSSFNVDLNWEVNWSNQPVIDFRRRQRGGTTPPTGPPDPGTTTSSIERFETESGNVTSSVWAFGGYRSLVEKQLSKLRSVAGRTDTARAADVPLTTTSTAADFRDAYLIGSGSVAGHGFVPLPMPGWTVRYSGLSDWPLVKKAVESLALNHSYNATYTTSFNSNSTAGEAETVPVGSEAFPYREAEFQPQSVQISEQFQPLIGVDITWPWELQTSLEWGRQVTTKLVGSNVVERKSSEISGNVSYSKRGLRLPFFDRIENRIRLSVSFTRSTSDEREFLLNEALTQAQQNPDTFDPGQALEGSNADVLTKQTRTTVSPQISYTISNRFTADFRLEYEKLDVQTGRQTSFTNLNGTFNLSVSLSQN